MVDKYMEGALEKWHVKTLLPMPCIVLSSEAGEYMQPVYACGIGIRAMRSWYCNVLASGRSAGI